MNAQILGRGAILTFGLPNRLGFWEEVKIGRYKVYIEYLYEAVEEEPHMREVMVDVYQGGEGRRRKRWRFVRTWRAGEVRTKLALKAVRVRISKQARPRLDEIKDALLRHILERVEHGR